MHYSAGAEYNVPKAAEYFLDYLIGLGQLRDVLCHNLCVVIQSVQSKL